MSQRLFVKLWVTSGLTWVGLGSASQPSERESRKLPCAWLRAGAKYQAPAECCSHNVSLTLFSFSSMKRLKPPLWSTTTGERLSFLAIFHTYKHKDVEIDSVVTEFAPDGVTVTRQTSLSSRAYTFKISLYPPPENQFRKMSTTNNNVVMAHFSFSWLVESPCVCSYYRNSETVLGNSFVILSDVYTHS